MANPEFFSHIILIIAWCFHPPANRFKRFHCKAQRYFSTSPYGQHGNYVKATLEAITTERARFTNASMGFGFSERLHNLEDSIGSRQYGIGMCLGLAILHMQARAQEVEEAEEHSASAILYSCTSTWQSIGTVFMRERPSAEDVKLVDVLVRVVRGIDPGKHAVHIHETANCYPSSAAWGHFDPGPNSNSSPDGNHPFHAGDLTNLTIHDHGEGNLMTVTSRVSLSDGPLLLFDEDGSAVVVHVAPDTYCRRVRRLGVPAVGGCVRRHSEPRRS